jgi:hypothetical protein
MPPVSYLVLVLARVTATAPHTFAVRAGEILEDYGIYSVHIYKPAQKCYFSWDFISVNTFEKLSFYSF